MRLVRVWIVTFGKTSNSLCITLLMEYILLFMFPNLLQGLHRGLQLLPFGHLLLPSATQSTGAGQSLLALVPWGPLNKQGNGTFVAIIRPSLITKMPLTVHTHFLPLFSIFCLLPPLYINLYKPQCLNENCKVE